MFISYPSIYRQFISYVNLNTESILLVEYTIIFIFIRAYNAKRRHYINLNRFYKLLYVKIITKRTTTSETFKTLLKIVNSKNKVFKLLVLFYWNKIATSILYLHGVGLFVLILHNLLILYTVLIMYHLVACTFLFYTFIIF